MLSLGSIGFITTALELVATSIGAGALFGGFVAAGFGVMVGKSRKEMEGNAMRVAFAGGVFGMSCLCTDLLLRYGA